MSCRATHRTGNVHLFSLFGRIAETQNTKLLVKIEFGRIEYAHDSAAGKMQTLCSTVKADVVLTREKGKNGQLAKMLDQRQIQWLEMPLIETAAGPDRERLTEALREEVFGWVVITSPEAAAVFLRGWREAGKPQVRIAVVGAGSGKVLEEEGEPEQLQIAFTPSKANAVHLSAELPLEDAPGIRVLYPSSAKAGSDLQAGLERRGCEVVRLNTYDTVHVKELEPRQLELAKAAHVVAIASPSAVKAWVKFAGGQEQTDVAFACIGHTSARAAEGLGLERIYYPEAPGLEGFVRSIEDALQSSKPVAA